MIQIDPQNWRSLENGSPVQREAYRILLETEIFQLLRPFNPAHIGTIGNDIDIPGSDIDIICSAVDFEEVRSKLASKFSSLHGYCTHITFTRGNEAFVANIPTSIPIEIYCEQRPITEQLGYRHYLIACRVLLLAGPEGHEHIRALKRVGVKTEPAFAKILGLPGDPYLSLLELEKKIDLEILQLLRSHSAE